MALSHSPWVNSLTHDNPAPLPSVFSMMLWKRNNSHLLVLLCVPFWFSAIITSTLLSESAQSEGEGQFVLNVYVRQKLFIWREIDKSADADRTRVRRLLLRWRGRNIRGILVRAFSTRTNWEETTDYAKLYWCVSRACDCMMKYRPRRSPDAFQTLLRRTRSSQRSRGVPLRASLA